MTPYPEDIARFLDELGQFASRDLPYRSDVGLLLHQAKVTGNMKSFEDLIFLAKFVSRTYEVMRRIGADADGYDNLAREFKESAQKAISLSRTLLEKAPLADRQRFDDAYVGLRQENFSRFLGLLGDLSWVKNWRVDGKPLP